MIETISRTGYAFLRYLATRLLRIDLMLLALVVTLTTIGFIALFSAGYSFPWRIEGQIRNIACEAGIDDGGRAAALADDDILGHENLLVPFTDKLDFLCAAAPLRAVPVSRSVHPAQCTDGGTANNR